MFRNNNCGFCKSMEGAESCNIWQNYLRHKFKNVMFEPSMSQIPGRPFCCNKCVIRNKEKVCPGCKKIKNNLKSKFENNFDPMAKQFVDKCSSPRPNSVEVTTEFIDGVNIRELKANSPTPTNTIQVVPVYDETIVKSTSPVVPISCASISSFVNSKSEYLAELDDNFKAKNIEVDTNAKSNQSLESKTKTAEKNSYATCYIDENEDSSAHRIEGVNSPFEDMLSHASSLPNQCNVKPVKAVPVNNSDVVISIKQKMKLLVRGLLLMFDKVLTEESNKILSSSVVKIIRKGDPPHEGGSSSHPTDYLAQEDGHDSHLLFSDRVSYANDFTNKFAQSPKTQETSNQMPKSGDLKAQDRCQSMFMKLHAPGMESVQDAITPDSLSATNNIVTEVEKAFEYYPQNSAMDFKDIIKPGDIQTTPEVKQKTIPNDEDKRKSSLKDEEKQKTMQNDEETHGVKKTKISFISKSRLSMDKPNDLQQEMNTQTQSQNSTKNDPEDGVIPPHSEIAHNQTESSERKSVKNELTSASSLNQLDVKSQTSTANSDGKTGSGSSENSYYSDIGGFLSYQKNNKPNTNIEIDTHKLQLEHDFPKLSHILHMDK